MPKMGWHYGPCKESGKAIGVFLIIGAVTAGEIAKHYKGVETGIESVFTVVAISAIVAAIVSMFVIIRVVMHSQDRRVRKFIRINERVSMEIPQGRTAIAEAFRTWLTLDHATQCSKEWDWLTNLNDGNRALAQARLEGKEVE